MFGLMFSCTYIMGTIFTQLRAFVLHFHFNAILVQMFETKWRSERFEKYLKQMFWNKNNSGLLIQTIA